MAEEVTVPRHLLRGHHRTALLRCCILQSKSLGCCMSPLSKGQAVNRGVALRAHLLRRGWQRAGRDVVAATFLLSAGCSLESCGVTMTRDSAQSYTLLCQEETSVVQLLLLRKNAILAKAKPVLRGVLPALWARPVTRLKASRRWQKVGTGFMVSWDGRTGSSSWGACRQHPWLLSLALAALMLLVRSDGSHGTVLWS